MLIFLFFGYFKLSQDLSQITESNTENTFSFNQSANNLVAPANSSLASSNTSDSISGTTKVHNSGTTMERSKSGSSNINNPHSVLQMDAFNHHSSDAINASNSNSTGSMIGSNNEAFGKINVLFLLNNSR